jgi:1-acyl-sn-glycerol-3-phosphate acyltransferase
MANVDPPSDPLTLAEFIGKQFAKWILYVMGWKPFYVNPEKYKNQKLVLTISHTSTWDGVIFMIYKFAHPEIFRNTFVVIKPQIFDALPAFVHPLLNKIGLIKATAYENSNGGFVNATINALKDKNEFMFIISPKGKISNSPWRTGYYVIAKELNCKIVPCGLDYENKCLSFNDPLSINITKEEMEKKVQSQLGEIVPLHIQNSEFPVHKSSSNQTIVSFSFVLISLIIFLSYLGWHYKLMFFVVLILLFALI